MRKSKQFISIPVISLDEGKQIGIIKSLVIDPIQKKVAALIIEQKGWFQEQKFISYSNVHSVGNDAITIKHSTVVRKGNSLPEIINLAKNPVNINGARIVTESGTVLGDVDDYYVDLTSGEIVGMEFRGSYISGIFNGKAFLDIEHILTVGNEMIVCSDKTLEKDVKLDGGLQERLSSVKNVTGNLWESTLERTKGLSSNMNKSINKLKRSKKEEDNYSTLPLDKKIDEPIPPEKPLNKE